MVRYPKVLFWRIASRSLALHTWESKGMWFPSLDSPGGFLSPWVSGIESKPNFFLILS